RRGRLQGDDLAERYLAAPVGHEDLDVVHAAQLRDAIAEVVESGTKPPARIAHVAVVPRAQDDREEWSAVRHQRARFTFRPCQSFQSVPGHATSGWPATPAAAEAVR